jgi:hypothetical protein
MYMRLMGYPASSISILTTYNGQKSLIEDVINTVHAPFPSTASLLVFVAIAGFVFFALGWDPLPACPPSRPRLFPSQRLLPCSGAGACRSLADPRLYLRWIGTRASKTTSFCCLWCAPKAWATCGMSVVWLWRYGVLPWLAAVAGCLAFCRCLRVCIEPEWFCWTMFACACVHGTCLFG